MISPDRREDNRYFYDKYWAARWKLVFSYDIKSKMSFARYVLKMSGFRDGGKAVLDIGFGSGAMIFMFDRSDELGGLEL